MGDFIKRGFIEFKTLSPVYIGCGRIASKKEYLYDQKTGKVEILQMDKVFEKIQKLHLTSAFENYLLASDREASRRNGKDLLDFLQLNHISPKEYGTWSKEIVKVADKEMNIHSIKDINLFIRNEQGLPYIPASSFKGMLRTALEEAHYLNDRGEADKIGDRIVERVKESRRYRPRRDAFLKEEDTDIDVDSLHQAHFEPQKDESDAKNLRNQKNDLLRGLLIGDSSALSWDDMCICEKIDMNEEGAEKSLNVLREAIKPGVTIRIPITIDTRICSYSTKDLLGAIRSFYTRYKNAFSDQFTKAPQIAGNSTTFFLGGGTGYVSKTVTYGILDGKEAVETVAAIINATLNDETKRKHGHEDDPQRGVSPHMLKCTKYNGKLYQMGACHITKFK